MKKLTILLLCAALLLLPGCAQKHPENTLVVGTCPDYPPFSYRTVDEQGTETLLGADLELARLLADSMDMKLEIREYPYDELAAALKKGKIDLVLAGLEDTGLPGGMTGTMVYFIAPGADYPRPATRPARNETRPNQAVGFCGAVAEGDPLGLLEQVNRALLELERSGEIARMVEQAAKSSGTAIFG